MQPVVRPKVHGGDGDEAGAEEREVEVVLPGADVVPRRGEHLQRLLDQPEDPDGHEERRGDDPQQVALYINTPAVVVSRPP